MSTTLSDESIARVAHEANRAYCAYCLAPSDHSQPAWYVAPEWQRTSAIKGVQFHRDNPKTTDSASHDAWLVEKQATGWKYGPVKDPEKKEHPCCVPFDKLPKEQQLKDRLFRSIVHALAHA